ncbi:MAG TPA: tRNA (adenosine(37)-N6)-threonylcarbamoyltransferase complex ATPase subunit type 1 TsaE [Patescibacteria group bacterium]|nr:tRNA (adenosine(37)-N6)-threonylcarbamoyltransferase complex ATPase subunit type 1 TsaE [Patescibacteria group bacterium]
MRYESHSEEETKKIAAEFARDLHEGDVIFLSGELGSGKTTFVRGVAEAYGFHEPVRSPSFTIVNRYPVEHATVKQILHVDFYRIDDPSEIPPLALEEELGRPDTVAFIEWPEKAPGLFIATYQVACQTGDTHTFTITPLLPQHAGSRRSL